jgi:hypothetical protein
MNFRCLTLVFAPACWTCDDDETETVTLVWSPRGFVTARSFRSPYRQRLCVTRDNGDRRVASDVYTIYDDEMWVGRCSRGETATFTPAQVSLRQTCTVYLIQDGDGFEGGTDGERCCSHLGGADNPVSEATLTRTEALSWDRGFDSSGNQVWGVKAGPYQVLGKSTDVV